MKFLLSILFVFFFNSVSIFGQNESNLVVENNFSNLQFRNVGPYRGGRVNAVCGIPQDPLTYYFGSTGGGVWKTADGGKNWQKVLCK